MLKEHCLQTDGFTGKKLRRTLIISIIMILNVSKTLTDRNANGTEKNPFICENLVFNKRSISNTEQMDFSMSDIEITW